MNFEFNHLSENLLIRKNNKKSIFLFLSSDESLQQIPPTTPCQSTKIRHPTVKEVE